MPQVTLEVRHRLNGAEKHLKCTLFIPGQAWNTRQLVLGHDHEGILLDELAHFLEALLLLYI